MRRQQQAMYSTNGPVHPGPGLVPEQWMDSSASGVLHSSSNFDEEHRGKESEEYLNTNKWAGHEEERGPHSVRVNQHAPNFTRQQKQLRDLSFGDP